MYRRIPLLRSPAITELERRFNGGKAFTDARDAIKAAINALEES